MVDLKEKWVFITGASRGIGYLAAKFMAEQGCNLILHSREMAHTEKVLQEVMFETPSNATIEKIIIDKENVEDITVIPEIIINENKKRKEKERKPRIENNEYKLTRKNDVV